MRESLELLQWLADAGADEAHDDRPRDYTVKTEPAPASDAPSAALPPRDAPPAALPMHHVPAAGLAEATRMAAETTTLAQLEQAVRAFEGCAIKRTATNTVFADGNPEAKLMLIGEAPGAHEDARGIPFCGPSGELLDKMLAAIGYDRTKAYITNTIFWRPPGNRQPNTEELALCRPFVEKHIALTDPRLLVLVGGTAAKAILATEQGITRLRGKSYVYKSNINQKEYKVAIIYHPSYLLRQPAQKRATWQDLRAIRDFMATP